MQKATQVLDSRQSSDYTSKPLAVSGAEQHQTEAEFSGGSNPATRNVAVRHPHAQPDLKPARPYQAFPIL